MERTPKKQPKTNLTRWLRLCPCSYPGAPGPGYSLNYYTNVKHICCSSLSLTSSSSSSLSFSSSIVQSSKNKKQLRRKNNNHYHNRSTSIVTNSITWILLVLIWLGSPFIIDCKSSYSDSNNMLEQQNYQFRQYDNDIDIVDLNTMNRNNELKEQQQQLEIHQEENERPQRNNHNRIEQKQTNDLSSKSTSSSSSSSLSSLSTLLSLTTLSLSSSLPLNNYYETKTSNKHQLTSKWPIYNKSFEQQNVKRHQQQQHHTNKEYNHQSSINKNNKIDKINSKNNNKLQQLLKHRQNQQTIIASIGCPNCIYSIEPTFDRLSSTLSTILMSSSELVKFQQQNRQSNQPSFQQEKDEQQKKLTTTTTTTTNNDNNQRYSDRQSSSSSSSSDIINSNRKSSSDKNINDNVSDIINDSDNINNLNENENIDSININNDETTKNIFLVHSIPLITTDSIRIESIKHQILTKLGFKHKPNITHELPKEIILETLSRAEEINSKSNNNDNDKLIKNYKNINYNNNDNINYISSDKMNYYKKFKQSSQNNNDIDNDNSDEEKNYNYYNSNDKHTNNDNDNEYYYKSNVPTTINPLSLSSFNFRQHHQQQLQQNDIDSEPDDFYGRTREIISFAEKGEILNGQRLIEFSTSDDRISGGHHDLQVRSAILWIKIELRSGYRKYRRKDMHNFERNLTIWVFRVIEPYFIQNSTFLIDKEFDQHTAICSSKIVQMSKLGWQKIDITTTVRRWYADGNSKRLRLFVDCSGCGDRVHLHIFNDATYQQQQSSQHNHNYNNNHHHHHHHHQQMNFNHSKIKFQNYHNFNKISYFPSSSSLSSSSSSSSSTSTKTIEPHRPFLVIYTDPNIMKRVRRRAIDCSGALKGQCCKEKFYVNFKELGWDDWIIAPHGYYANYCQGDCSGPRTPDKFQSYHSHVIEEYRKMDRLSGLQPCCAPLKFSSMSLIYYEENKKIVKRDLPKMVVDECGCP